MSTWTSKLRIGKAAGALCGAVLLSGCLSLGGSAAQPEDGKSLLQTLQTGRSFAVRSAAIVPDKVVAKGPAGYCLDKRSIKAARSGGFALVAPCAALGAKTDGLGLEPVLLTVQAQPQLLQRGQVSADGLAEAFAENEPIFRENGDGMSLVQLAKGGDTLVPNGDPKHWRAALNFNGYLIGLAVYSEKGGPASDAAGKALLIGFAEAILAASPIASAAAE